MADKLQQSSKRSGHEGSSYQRPGDGQQGAKKKQRLELSPEARAAFTNANLCRDFASPDGCQRRNCRYAHDKAMSDKILATFNK